MSTLHPSSFLRAALWLDVTASGGAALLQLALGSTLAAWTGLSPALLLESGLVMVAWAAWLAHLARQPTLSPARIQAVIAGNAAWSAAALVLALALQPAPAGWAWLTLHIVPVAAFAGLQALGLRRSAPAAGRGATP